MFLLFKYLHKTRRKNPLSTEDQCWSQMTIVRCGGVDGRVMSVTPILWYAWNSQIGDVTDRTVSIACDIDKGR